MTQLVKCSVCEHEDVSSNPKHPFENTSMGTHVYNASSGENRDG